MSIGAAVTAHCLLATTGCSAGCRLGERVCGSAPSDPAPRRRRPSSPQLAGGRARKEASRALSSALPRRAKRGGGGGCGRSRALRSRSRRGQLPCRRGRAPFGCGRRFAGVRWARGCPSDFPQQASGGRAQMSGASCAMCAGARTGCRLGGGRRLRRCCGGSVAG